MPTMKIYAIAIMSEYLYPALGGIAGYWLGQSVLMVAVGAAVGFVIYDASERKVVSKPIKVIQPGPTGHQPCTAWTTRNGHSTCSPTGCAPCPP